MKDNNAVKNFYIRTLKEAQSAYQELLNKPGARSTNHSRELSSIISQVEFSIKCGDISKKDGLDLIAEFRKINFENITKDRAEKARLERISTIKRSA